MFDFLKPLIVFFFESNNQFVFCPTQSRVAIINVGQKNIIIVTPKWHHTLDAILGLYLFGVFIA